jgi:DNA polymerase III subunit epsilon
MEIHKLIHTPINDLTFSVVDTETTGMNSVFNRIVDIGVVKVNNGKITDTWETLIDPKQDIPDFITRYTHIVNSDVAGKPTFDKIIDSYLRNTAESIFVAHNAGFDYSFMAEEFKRLRRVFNPPRLCTVQLGRKLLPHLPSVNLDFLSQYYDIRISQRHRALPDALATAEILIKFIDIAKNVHKAKTFFDLERLQRISAWNINKSTHEQEYGLFD